MYSKTADSLRNRLMANPVDYDTTASMHPIEKSGCIFAPSSFPQQKLLSVLVADCISIVLVAVFVNIINAAFYIWRSVVCSMCIRADEHYHLVFQKLTSELS